MSAMGLGQDKITTLGLNTKDGDVVIVETLSLGKIIRSLKAREVYAILGAAGLLVAAGYRLKLETARIKSAADESKIVRLNEQHNKDIEEKRLLTKKVQFLTLTGRDNKKSPVASKKRGKRSEQDQNQDHQPAKEVARFLDSNVGADKDENGIADLEVAQGANRNDSRIRFRDGSSYDIPENVKNLTRNVTWMKSKSESTPLTILQSLPNKETLINPPGEPLSKPIPFVDPLKENEIERPSAKESLPPIPHLTGSVSNSKINRKEAETSPTTTKCVLLHLKTLGSFSHRRV
jgi:hypothetical protein